MIKFSSNSWKGKKKFFCNNLNHNVKKIWTLLNLNFRLVPPLRRLRGPNIVHIKEEQNVENAYKVSPRQAYIPTHVNPFPEKPVLHSHLNDPGMLMQTAFASQRLSMHSLLSGKDDSWLTYSNRERGWKMKRRYMRSPLFSKGHKVFLFHISKLFSR